MKATDLHNIFWANYEGDGIYISETDTSYYLECPDYSFDIEFKTSKEVFAFLKDGDFYLSGYLKGI